MNENVTKFFELYAQDAGLRAKWLEEPDDGGDAYWLLDRGWSDDEAKFCGGK